jgi:hypothetical protein
MHLSVPLVILTLISLKVTDRDSLQCCAARAMLPHSGSGVPTLARASPELHEFQALGDVLERIPNSDSAQLSEEVLTSREAFSCGREERAGDRRVNA